MVSKNSNFGPQTAKNLQAANAGATIHARLTEENTALAQLLEQHTSILTGFSHQ